MKSGSSMPEAAVDQHRLLGQDHERVDRDGTDPGHDASATGSTCTSPATR